MIEIKHFSPNFPISIVPFTDHLPATVRCCFYLGMVVFPKNRFSIDHFIHREERERGGAGERSPRQKEKTGNGS